MTVQRDYFTILEIGAEANEQEIRAAYRRLARRYHPDLHPERTDAEQRLKELNEAYAVLSDPVQRARYLGTRRVRIRVQAAPSAPPPGPRRAASPPSTPPPPPPAYVVHGSHVDLSGRRAGQRAYGGVGGGRPGARYGSAPRQGPLDEDELALLYVRRLLRALFGW